MPQEDTAPCPFCGSASVDFKEYETEAAVAVQCKACLAEGPAALTNEAALLLWNLGRK